MFRHEIHCTLTMILVMAWLGPIYLLVSYSLENQALKQEGEILKAELEGLQLGLDSRGRSNQNPEETKSSKSFKRHALLAPEMTKSLTRNNNSDHINLFIETSHFPKQRQFYKSSGQTSDTDLYSLVSQLSEDRRKRILVSGGAGFVGSHLVDSLMLDGHEVIVCDNFFTGRKSNIEHWQGHPNFELIHHDVINPLMIEVNEIYHLASPASPVHYMSNPIKTIKTNTLGTMNLLGLAKRVGARIVIASTSEIYGDPKVHPQPETYWGNTNPIGPRSCYDESKRLSETLATAYSSRENVSIAIARIFNTYGPRMHPNDGRVVSNFVIQAIESRPITVYGSGSQTRSFQYITDLVSGLKKLMASGVTSPVNLGNPDEMTIHSLALHIKQVMTNSTSDMIFNKLPVDDPHRRKPDIRKAQRLLNWKPHVAFREGLQRTIDYFSQEIRVN